MRARLSEGLVGMREAIMPSVPFFMLDIRFLALLWSNLNG